MSYKALYRKYRPINFASVVGQTTVVNILKQSIINNHISHAYLFYGPRGTGKTSVAKIFAKAVNCLDFKDDLCGKCDNCIALDTNDLDIVEIDAASNNGVEEIRSIRDNVKLLPSFGKFKIYIIDEVHMLSTGAFNALLKTLEEPPSHVIFILATTEINKIPLTILSRCQRFDFLKISNKDIFNRLKYIKEKENINISDEALNYISENSDGGLRDSINLLDQVSILNKDQINIDDIDKLSGSVPKTKIFNIFDSIIKNDYKNLLDIINDISNNGQNFNELVDNMLIILRDISINYQIEDYFEKKYSDILIKYNVLNSYDLKITDLLNDLSREIKNSTNQKILLEIYLLNITNMINNSNDFNNLSSRIIDNSHNTISDKLDVNEIDNKLCIDVENMKKIRINNLLFGANKTFLNDYMSKISDINDYMSDKRLNKIVVLINESNLVCASSEYLLFTLDNQVQIDLFYENINNIDDLLSKIYQTNIKTICVSNEEWKNIKNDYISMKKNGKKYVFIDENDVKLNSETNLVEKQDSDVASMANNLFGTESVNNK